MCQLRVGNMDASAVKFGNLPQLLLLLLLMMMMWFDSCTSTTPSYGGETDALLPPSINQSINQGPDFQKILGKT